MRIRFRYLSKVPKVTYGKKAKESSKPLRKPKMWAMLSIHGRRPHRKRKRTMPNSFRKAFQGFSSICQAWNSSTKRQARSPNWDPAGPTCSKRVKKRKTSYILLFKTILTKEGLLTQKTPSALQMQNTYMHNRDKMHTSCAPVTQGAG